MSALLLDTHIWLWYAEGMDEKLSPQAIRTIDAARKQSGLLVSAISVWELGMQVAKGRVQLSAPLAQWVRHATHAPGIRLVSLDADILVESTELPGEPHGDPADRFLIATARTLNATLATRDSDLLKYAQSGFVRAVKI